MKSIGKKVLIALSLMALLLLAGCGDGGTSTSTSTSSPSTADVPPEPPQIVSTDFAEFGEVYCDSESTTLKKKTLFNENFKGKYVTWSGTVGSVTESSGKYTLGVKHCDDTWTWDIDVKMRADQKDALLDLKEDGQVTYTAKMKRIGGLLTDLAAEDGVVVS